MSEIRKLKNYINGEWVASSTTTYEKVVNPATKEVMCEVPLSTLEDLNKAAAVAQGTFQEWKNVAVPRRARILYKFHQLYFIEINVICQTEYNDNAGYHF